MRVLGTLVPLVGIIIPCIVVHFSNNKPFNRNSTTQSRSPLFNNILWTHVIHTSLSSRPLFTRLLFKTDNNPIHLAIILLMAGDVSINPGPLSIPDHCKNSVMAFANVRSIKARYDSVIDLIKTKKVDIFCMNETWLTNTETDSLLTEITPPTHNLHSTPRVGKRGGGVGIFVGKKLESKCLRIPSFKSFEAILVSVNFLKSTVNFVSFYRPPTTNFQFFVDEFCSLLELLVSRPSPFIICGDFNIQVDVDSANTQKFLELLNSWDLSQHVDFFTHDHNHTLDLLLSQSSNNLVGNTQESEWFCDHRCVLATLNTFVSSVENVKQVTYRAFHLINLNDFKQDIADSDFCKNLSSTPHSLYDEYHKTLSALLNKHAPLKTKNLKQKSDLLINPKIIQAKKDKRQLERKWRKYKTPYDRSRFRKQVNYCNLLIRSEKNRQYKERIASGSDNPKKLWKELNHILHRTPEPALPKYDELSTLTESFSSYFIDKIQNIRSQFPHVNDSPSLQSTSVPTTCSFSKFRQVTEAELSKIIKSSPIKSSSLDPIPTFLLLDCLDVLIKPLTLFINICLNHGVFPDQFKLALVSPLLKKPSLPKEELKNYRPVSNLNYISKLLERVIAGQLNCYLHDNYLINPFQSAYKAGHSTESALLKIKSDIHLSLSKGHCTALTLLDLSAAFDTIDHALLLERLSSDYGLSGSVLKWFTSYLTNRRQSVKIKDELSSERNLLYGVPQGSVLGPVLFTLYTAPLSKIISTFSSLSHHLYADDTQIYLDLTPNTISSSIEQLQECLSAVQSWMAKNKLKLNPDKTEFIVLGTEKQQTKLANHFPINIMGNMVSPCSKVKNLGVIFDSTLSMSKHVSLVRSSCFYHIRDFSRIRRILSKSVAVTLANALVGSRLDYCNSLMYGITQKQSRRLQAIQNTLSRIISYLPRRASTSNARKLLHWLPVEFRVKFKLLVITYKALNTHQPPYLAGCLNEYSCNRYTRRSNPDNKFLNIPVFIHKTHKSKSHFDCSFEIAAPSLWNSLPLHVRTATSLASFRSRLKCHFFTLAFPP